jgi:hypothetical protein
MINKSTLVDIVDRYSLDKQVETVKWVVNNKNLVVDFMTPTRDCIGKVESNNFDLEDSELGIHNTSQLNKLIKITSGDLLVEVEKRNNIPAKLLISDQFFNLAYTLGDPVLFDKVGEVKEPENYQAVIEIGDEDINNFSKANDALQDNDNVIVNTKVDITDQKVISFSFGDITAHTNKVEYNIPCDYTGELQSIPFNSKLIQTILRANKSGEKALMSINEGGLMKLEFSDRELKSLYYILRKG